MTKRRETLGSRELLLFSVGFTFLFGLLAHGFRYFSLSFSHDATLAFQVDDTWQIQLGRFLQPLYLALRGRLVAPFLVGMFSLAFLSLAVCLVARLLAFDRPLPLALLAGLMATQASLTFSNASFLPWSDIFMCSLLLSVASVTLWTKGKWGFLPGSVTLCLSLGLYPSYLETAAFLLLLLVVRDLLLSPEEGVKPALVKCGKALVTVFLGLALYAAVLYGTLHVLGLKVSTWYNGVGRATQFAGTNYAALFLDTYKFVWTSFLSPATFHARPAALLHVLLALAGLGGFVLLCRRKRRSPAQWALLLALVALMPFGVNVVYFISKGMKHGLMTYSFVFAGVFLLWIWNTLWKERPDARPVRLGRTAVACGLGILLLCNVVFANQVYLRKGLEAENTRVVISRMLDRIEETPGYRAGETPVALVGELSNGPLAMSRPGYEAIRGVGLEEPFDVTNYVAYDYYFQYVMGYPIHLIPRAEALPYAKLPEVEALPVFPAAGCTLMLDGVLVIRLS